MHLVHIYLRPPECGRPLPRETEELLAGSAADADGCELVVAHPQVEPHPVVGVYIRASSLEAAEERAGAIWHSASAVHPQLRPWVLVRAEIPLLLPDLDW
ncbi:hypothetical protein [Streptomyces sp. cmx-4-9]|uniref:hypothetical protein n=1 Tax=Streptomyces sp. cmx-4-9 TaxID=2790941 RepID=UPI0039814274